MGGRVLDRRRRGLGDAPGPRDGAVRERPPGAAHGTDVDERGEGTLTEPRLYQLVRQPRPVTERTFGITFLDPGVRAYAFTFG